MAAIKPDASELIMRLLDSGEEIPIPVEGKFSAFGPMNKDTLWWNTPNGELIRYHVKSGKKDVLKAPISGILHHGNASDDGNMALSRSRFGSNPMLLWDFSQEAPVPKPLTHGSDLVILARVSGDGTRAITTIFEEVYFWDLTQDPLQPRPLKGANLVFHVAFSPDSKRVLTGTVDGKVRLWDFETGAPLTEPLRQHGNTVAVAFGPNGRLAAGMAITPEREGTGHHMATISVWDLQTQEQVMSSVRLTNIYPDLDLSGSGLESTPQLRFRQDATQIYAVWNNIVSVVDLAPALGEEPIPAWVPDFC